MTRLTEIADEKVREAEEYVDEPWLQRRLLSDADLLRKADAALMRAAEHHGYWYCPCCWMYSPNPEHHRRHGEDCEWLTYEIAADRQRALHASRSGEGGGSE